MEYSTATVARNPRGKGWRGIVGFKNDDGKWTNRTKVLKGAKTKAEAKKLLREWLAELDSEVEVSSDSALDYGLALVEKKLSLKSISPVTAADYRKSLNGWKGHLDGMTLSEVTPETIESALGDMLASSSITTVRKRYVALNMVFDDAVRAGLLKSNPMSTVPRPKAVRSENNAIVGAELERVKERLASLELAPWVVGAYLCLYAGLRAEEACGLQVGDIDLENRIGWVRRSIATARGGSYVSAPKNGKPRDFPITDTLARVLSDWLSTIDNSPSTWLLSPDGRMPTVRRIGSRWSALCDVEGYKGKAGRKPTLHDLRHSFATQCVSAGMDVKTLQSILGHSSAAITLDVYATSDPRAKAAAGELIECAI